MQLRSALKTAVLQLQWARVDLVGLRDTALAAARKVIADGLSAIDEGTPVGTCARVELSDSTSCFWKNIDPV